jgi:phosphoglycolate phosphatase
MTSRAFLFDMDGTLVDSLADIGGSMNFVLGTLGFPEHPIADYKMLVGEGASSLVAKSLPPGQEALRADALARYRSHYATNLVARSRPYEGIVPLLAALRARGDRIAVVTNKPQAPAGAIVDALFARGTFDVVVGEREGVARKPDPAPALVAAEALGVAPSACVFVGDTSVDILTARAAKMRGVGVLWGFRDREELETAGADHIVAQPDEILGL